MTLFRENVFLCSTPTRATWNNTLGRNACITLFLLSHLFFADQDARHEVVWIISMCQPHEHTPRAWYETFVWVIYSWCIQQQEAAGENTNIYVCVYLSIYLSR